jgi:hypothetical protein
MKKYLPVLLSLWLCAACSVTLTPEPSPTATSTPVTSTVTPTIVWFPPTPTPSPFPTPIITPTADMRPKLGDILLKDDFSDPKQWQLSQTDSGSVALGKNELTIAIAETDATLYSFREQPTFSDFYLEITTTPSLCRGLDEYGVLFRVTPTLDYYRFSLSCDGQVRLDRIIGDQASSPQPWMLSGAVPPGAPSSSRLGVAAAGSKMDFFINGKYQFSVQDPLLSSGSLGVFARSANKMAVTVNFSDLVVYQILP